MSDDEDDPFERLDKSVGDREGNPFERLDDEAQPNESDASADQSDGHTEWPSGDGDGYEASDIATETDTRPEYDAHSVTPADHLDEVPDEDPDEREEQSEFVEQESPSIDADSTATDTSFEDVGTREGDPFEDDVFEQMDVAELDPDEVWASISEAEEEGSVTQRKERVYAEVSKHSYCEQCEFFSDPPDVRCSHDGTEIMEFLDQTTVRVVDCPVVAERKELQKHE
ncbi:hypothetical protein [Salinibaculum salinum]|uniref:hypothetical protein n=1 Tax=Salinibaculum salinum TaxID=3131996 RepID=UPI0030EE3C11